MSNYIVYSLGGFLVFWAIIGIALIIKYNDAILIKNIGPKRFYLVMFIGGPIMWIMEILSLIFVLVAFPYLIASALLKRILKVR